MKKNESMYIHRPEANLSASENFLRMLRPDMKYTKLEAQVLDVALLLHMEHGGGNNSTFYQSGNFIGFGHLFCNSGGAFFFEGA